jgi:S1-C subfamily serine protease
MRSILVALLLAATAAAAPCGNCHGDRVVGPGPVRFACPVCDGTGQIPDPAPVTAAASGPRPAVCRIECGSGPSRDCGSGVLVEAKDGRAVVLTAWHVVRGNRDSITVRWPDGTSGPARVLASDDAFDLAALATAAPAAAPVPLASRTPGVGDRLTLAGYGPTPFVYREASGAVTQFVGPTGRHPAHMLELRAHARQGDSGGPILNEAGELVAVLWGSSRGLTAGSHLAEIRPLLAQARQACPDGRCAKR